MPLCSFLSLDSFPICILLQIFGAKALELKRGKLALTVERGRVVTLEWQDTPGEQAEVA